MADVAKVRQQYERWPYPRVPLLGAVRREDTWQLNADFLWDRSGCGAAPRRPRIWIAGCGTVQPYVFRLANPRATILATDLSAHSLRIAARRCQWHGAYGVTFERVDLTQPTTLPDGPFDLIECYGVLMNLEDPLAALRELRARLAPRGVLRVMVYPHYGRRRIFQIQRIATLCGLRFENPDHPRILRRLIGGLDRSHPLRYAFDNYADAKNDEGLVDGFLHAGDRGFTGLEFGALCEAAGLVPGFWFHRPWARPDVMAPRLGLEHTSQSFVLHYLDLWQELRGNFVACLRRDDCEPTSASLRPHPMFEWPGGTDPRRYFAWFGHRIGGLGLRTRLDDEGHRIGARDVRRLDHLMNRPESDPETVARLRESGVLLGGERPRDELRPFGGSITPPPRGLPIGDHVPNPFYQHLFDAWAVQSDQSDGALPGLEDQLERWSEHAAPLEDTTRPSGLTPFGTYARHRETIEQALIRSTECESVADFADWPLRTERMHDVVTLLRAAGVAGIEDLSPATTRELWCLLASHDRLVLRDVFA